MRISYLLSMLLVLGNAGAAFARTPPPKLAVGWVYDGTRSCVFHTTVSPRPCGQYHQLIRHKVKGGPDWDEHHWMWKARGGFEVRYTSRIGILGISTFTIGQFYDAQSNLPRHMSNQAVSYAPSREELVIGVPAEGYEFSVKGGPL